MAEKLEVKEFLLELLKNYKGTHVSGDNIHCQCPFHLPRNNTSAFGVSFVEAEADFYPYHCFSCGVRGDIIRLIAHVNSCSLKKARSIFRKRVVQKPVTIQALQRLFEASNNRTSHSEQVKPIKLPPRAKSQRETVKYLKKRKRMAHDILEIPFIISTYDLYFCAEGRERGRIIMPIRDLDGNVVEFNDRAVKKEMRKSLHRKGNKTNDFLHGAYEAYGKHTGVVVEGAFDMFQVASVIRDNRSLHEYGVVNMMGTSLTESRYEELITIFDVVLLMYDSDDNDAVKRSFKHTAKLREEVEAHNITLQYPRGKDPGVCTEEQIVKALKARPERKTLLGQMREFFDP